MADTVRGPIGGATTPRIDPGTLNRGATSAPGISGKSASSPSSQAGSAGSGLFPGGYKWYKRYKQVDKWKKRYKSLKELAEEDTRSGELLKLGVDVLKKGVAHILEIEESAVAPFFKYYETHIKLLGELLNTQGKTERAKEKIKQAAEVAKSIRQQEEECTKKFAIASNPTLKQLDGYVAWWQSYCRNVQSTHATVTAEEASDIRSTLQLMKQLLLQAEEMMIEIFSTDHRIQMEFETLQEAYRDYKAKKEKMEKGNVFDRIFAKKNLEETEEYAALDNKEELYDPISYAKGSIRQMDKLAENWALAIDSLANGERLPKLK